MGPKPTGSPQPQQSAAAECAAILNIVGLRDELFAFLSGLPAWQQDLARRLSSTPRLEGDALDDALLMVLAAHGAAPADAVAPEPQDLRPEDLTDSPPAGPRARLTRLGSLRGVGAVAPDQEIGFAPDGLTIVYGPNAAGKSTYIRALKRVCRTVDTETPLLANVFEPGAGETPPSVRVETTTRNAEPLGRRVSLDEVDDELRGISVFDARCAEVYVTEENTVAFVSSLLAVLVRLAATQDRMRGEIEAMRDELLRDPLGFSELPPSAARTAVDGLTSNTDLSEIDTLATLTADERSRHGELQAAIASARARDVRAEAAAIRSQADQVDRLSARLRRDSLRTGPPPTRPE